MKFSRFSKVLAAGLTAAMLLTGCGSSNPTEAAKKKYADDVVLGQYKQLEYTPQVTTVTDEDIQSDINLLITKGTTTSSVTDRAAVDGDTVNLDYVGKLDGVAFDGGSTFQEDGTPTGTSLTLGSGTYIPGFEEQIVGHKPGEKFDINVTFPEEYSNTDLAGKETVFEITLNYIEEKNAPEYNDALVAAYTDYATTAEFEAAVRAQYEENNQRNDLYANQEALIALAVENADIIAYPEEELKERTDSIINSMKESAQSNNIDFVTYMTYYGFSSEEDVINALNDALKSYIERKMVVCAIAKAENIKVSEEEATAKTNELLAASGYSDVAQLNAAYNYTAEDYYQAVLEEKVLDLLTANAVEVASTEAPSEETTEAAETTEAQ